MSYCRKSGSSDVYVYALVGGGVECCGCSLSATGWGSFCCDTPDQMLQHLDQHLLAGHRVPRRARRRLRSERDGVDWIAEDWRRYCGKKRKPKDLW